MRQMEVVGKKAGLKGFEMVKEVRLVAEAFSVENGILTPTFKVKRADAAKRFRPLIDEMYRDLQARAPVAKL
ncbi:Long chain acyl-CoA synthetase 7 peroxisomal [Blyttiomyces sp. JEL0837]|nr:Long chain acyl-CoA synthetase 7 peroxisomal [Blyttiomyces sp. JEL0837]